MDEVSNHGLYSINTLANIDRSSSRSSTRRPAGTAWVRVGDTLIPDPQGFPETRDSRAERQPLLPVPPQADQPSPQRPHIPADRSSPYRDARPDGRLRLVERRRHGGQLRVRPLRHVRVEELRAGAHGLTSSSAASGPAYSPRRRSPTSVPKASTTPPRTEAREQSRKAPCPSACPTSTSFTPSGATDRATPAVTTT